MTKFYYVAVRAIGSAIGLACCAFPNVAFAQDLALEAAPAQAEVEVVLPQMEDGRVPEGSVGGMGDINLYPRRIVMDQRQRISSVGIYNKTPFEGEYEISITDMVMTETGAVIPVDNLPAGVDAAALNPASTMLRWSPRRVLLPGSEAQTVRIMARPPADLPAGEYRAHFMVVSVPKDVDEGFSIEDAVGDSAGAGESVGVTIRPRFGISIPVIIRIGETTLDVSLQDVSFGEDENGEFITLTIMRSGTRSAYGDLTITAAGIDEPVAIAKGIGVYPEIDSRMVRLALNPEFDRTRLTEGTVLTATFTDDDADPGRTLARREFSVP